MAALALSAALALAASAPDGSIEGLWMHPERSVVIHVAPCGEAMCGTVAWANEPARKAARRGVDPLVGARLLTGFRHRGKAVWKGRVFVPDLNLRVGGKIQPLRDNRLKVSGCLVGGLICGTQVWTRFGGTVSGGD